MYTIYVDGVLIFDDEIDELKIASAEITREINKSGSFKFSLYPDHAYYNSITELKSIIEVHKNGRAASIFRGRALYPEIDINLKKTYTCEGQLGFLLDTIMRPYTLTGTPAELFAEFVNNHNSQVEPEKRLEIGNVTVTGDSVTITSDAACTTSEAINKQLVDVYGGYITARFYSNGKWYLDYLEDFTSKSTQAITFGENILSFAKKDDHSNIITKLIPYGKDKLTIESVNGGSDTIQNETAVSMYGSITDTKTWSDIETPAELKTAAETYLADMVKRSLTFDLTAVDLSMLDSSIDSFKCEQYARIISEPHGLDDWFLISKQTINLLDPSKDKITLGKTYTPFTEQNSGLGAAVNTMSDEIKGVTEKATNIIAQALEVVTITDSRAVNNPPSWYFTTYGKRVVTEMKQSSALGITDAATYGALTTYIIWQNLSADTQQLFISGGNLYTRYSTAADGWTTWAKK